MKIEAFPFRPGSLVYMNFIKILCLTGSGSAFSLRTTQIKIRIKQKFRSVSALGDCEIQNVAIF
jgi:hypothetical protein